MRAPHRIRAGELPCTPVRAGLFALTRRAASTIRRCRGLQTKQCDQLSDQAKCKRHILWPGRCTDVDRLDETSLAILLPTPIRPVIVDSHSARMHSIRRRAAPTPTSYRLTPPYLILCAGALRPYPDAVIPCLARPPVTSRSLCQAASNPAAVRVSRLDLPSSAVSPLAGVTATAQRAGPARRSNQMMGHLQAVRSAQYRRFRLCGRFAAHACHPLPSATVRAHLALCSKPFVLPPSATTVNQPAACI